MAATCGNGYVFDKLLKRERELHIGILIVKLQSWAPDSANFVCLGALSTFLIYTFLHSCCYDSILICSLNE